MNIQKYFDQFTPAMKMLYSNKDGKPIQVTLFICHSCQ